MAVTLELKPEIEAQLRDQAQKFGQSVEESLQEWIEDRLIQRSVVVPPDPSIKNGADLVAYWEREGLIGSWAHRTDINDSIEYARQLRKKAECRER